jgi:hypothetical protein
MSFHHAVQHAALPAEDTLHSTCRRNDQAGHSKKARPTELFAPLTPSIPESRSVGGKRVALALSGCMQSETLNVYIV